MKQWQSFGWLLFFWALAAVAIWLVRDHVFFWDTVQLGSKHAHWYYQTRFADWLLPQEIDSGHPPTFGAYLAIAWCLFGKNLTISHLSMIPFLWLLLFYLWQLGRHLSKEHYAAWLCVLTVADPVLAAQSILISPDIPLSAFFLMAVYSILKNNTILKSLAFAALSAISLRGMMLVCALFIWEIVLLQPTWRALPRAIWSKIGPYLPAGGFALAFLTAHYARTGWIGYHPASPWAPSFERVDALGFFKNMAVLGWRLLDFGRVFVWIALIIALWGNKMYQILQKHHNFQQIFWLFIIILLVLSPSCLLHKGLSGHRYLLPAMLVLTMLTFTIFADNRYKNLIFSVLIVGLLTGNTWIYPDKISQGWDATLAHLPYYRLRADMIDFIEQQGIEPSAVGTAFPDIGPFYFRDLSNDSTGFSTKNLYNQSFILYSNIMNDFSDAEIDELRRRWTPLHSLQRRGVKFILYERNYLTER